jgi:hypothetical protein
MKNIYRTAVLSLVALIRAGFAGSAQTAKTDKLHRQNYPT